ncbi:MAG: hypothetical protein FWC64_06915 [Treponema sp.]|nr:hypothetical protein [Treponema sp.]
MDKVAEELSGINKTLEKILNVIDKPKSRFSNTLETAVLVVGILSVFHIIETIRQWIIGG